MKLTSVAYLIIQSMHPTYWLGCRCSAAGSDEGQAEFSHGILIRMI
jgi:hypothetical protein